MRSMNRIGNLGTLVLFTFTLALSGCDSSDDGGQGGKQKPNGDGPCEKASDCQGNVCVELIDGDHPPNYCTQECPCSSGFYCDEQTFGVAGLKFCRFGSSPPVDPKPPEEPPHLPCKVDADCKSGLVCATFKGEKDCTVPCADEESCTPPAFGGVIFDMATCGKDEGQARNVCLPDLACFQNPVPCVKTVFP